MRKVLKTNQEGKKYLYKKLKKKYLFYLPTKKNIVIDLKEYNKTIFETLLRKGRISYQGNT